MREQFTTLDVSANRTVSLKKHNDVAMCSVEIAIRFSFFGGAHTLIYAQCSCSMGKIVLLVGFTFHGDL